MSSLLLYSHNMKQLRNKTKGLTRSVTKEGWMIFLTSVCTCSECRIRKPFQSSYKWCSAKICFLPERPVLVKLNKWRICKHTLLWQKKLKKKSYFMFHVCWKLSSSIHPFATLASHLSKLLWKPRCCPPFGTGRTIPALACACTEGISPLPNSWPQ